MDNREEVMLELINELSTLTGFFNVKQIQKEAKEKGSGVSFSSQWFIGKPLSIDLFRVLERVHQFVAEQKAPLAIMELIYATNDVLRIINTFSKIDIDGDTNVQIDILSCFKKIKKEYDLWYATVYKLLIANFKGTFLFRDEEFADEKSFSPFLHSHIEETIKKNLFKTYVYREGNNKMSRDIEYHIYPKIGISHSLDQWLNFIDRQDDIVNNDKAVVTLFYKRDHISEHYNYFVITIHYRGTIWLSTDQISFYNPRNKSTRRKPERNSEDRYDNIGLPYELCEEINSLREKNTDILLANGGAFIKIPVKHDFFESNIDDIVLKLKNILSENNVITTSQLITGYNDIRIEFKHEGKIVAAAVILKHSNTFDLIIHRYDEMLQKDMADIATISKVYFVSLISRIFEELAYEPPTQVVTTGIRHINTKLLSYFEYNETGVDKEKMIGFEGNSKEIFDQLINSIGLDDAQSKELVTSQYSQVIKSSNFERDWLGTPQALDNVVKWSILEDKAALLKKNIGKLIDNNRIKNDIILLKSMLESKLDDLIKIANKGGTFIHEIHSSGFDSILKPQPFEWISIIKTNAGLKDNPGYSPYNYIDLLLPPYKYYEPQICKCCGEVKLKSWRYSFHVKSYKQLMALLGLTDRMGLPLSFRNYRSSQLIPYKGNSILDNVHPYALISDPVSDKYPNGLEVNVWMCGNCFIKKQKEYEARNK